MGDKKRCCYRRAICRTPWSFFNQTRCAFLHVSNALSVCRGVRMRSHASNAEPCWYKDPLHCKEASNQGNKHAYCSCEGQSCRSRKECINLSYAGKLQPGVLYLGSININGLRENMVEISKDDKNCWRINKILVTIMLYHFHLRKRTW